MVGLQPEHIIAIAVSLGVVALLAIVLAVLFGVPSIRKRVFPHRDRKTWNKST